MIFKEYDHVKIKERNITGVIVDLREWENACTVESDNRNDAGDFDMFDCSFDEIELV